MFPIIAPILLAETGANITAVWLGVMIGVNMQTSFLTPPFGFSLFYLRGVAPPSVSTIQIWKGAIAFIFLQLVGLAIVGYYPSLVNYLPNRTYLTSEVAPPPMNPRLQECMQEYKFNLYHTNEEKIKQSINDISSLDISYLPNEKKEVLLSTYSNAILTFELVQNLKNEDEILNNYNKEYKSLHKSVRKIQKRVFKIDIKIKDLKKEIRNLEREGKINKVDKILFQIEDLKNEKTSISSLIPKSWEEAHKQYKLLASNKKKAVMKYRRNVDDVYKNIQYFKLMIKNLSELEKLDDQINSLTFKINSFLYNRVNNDSKEKIMVQLKSLEKILNNIAGTELIIDNVSKTRKIFKKLDVEENSGGFNDPDIAKALSFFNEVNDLFINEKEWRKLAQNNLLSKLNEFDNSVSDTIGLRLQERLTIEQAKFVASCRSIHRDISLNF